MVAVVVVVVLVVVHAGSAGTLCYASKMLNVGAADADGRDADPDNE